MTISSVSSSWLRRKSPHWQLSGIGGRLRHDVGDGQPVFLAKRHVDARHQREVEGHVALVAVAEVGAHVGRPLVGFGEDQAVVIFGVDGGADLLDLGVGLGEVLADGAVALDQIGNGVEAQRVDAHVEPEAHGLEHLFHDARVVEVEIGLMREEAVPVVLLRDLVPGPVGLFGVGEDDAGAFEELVGVATRRTCRARASPWAHGGRPGTMDADRWCG